MSKPALLTSEACLRHDTGQGHPERPERLQALFTELERTGLRQELVDVAAPSIEREQLERLHPGTYIDHVAREIEVGARWVDSVDANVGPESWQAALRAAGGACRAVEGVLAGEWPQAFAAVRPPGHHAEESLAMGFCLFNNAALAARHAQSSGIERVAIVDWDVHHGNGTQHLFERDPNVLYASLHQHPHYPGTGQANERGLGEGEGATLNCPMAPGSGDSEWRAAMEDHVLPALEAFDPGMILISAGFDAHERDPLSETRVSSEGFAHFSRLLLQFARERCQGRLVSILEGGYDLQGLAEGTAAHLRPWLDGEN